MPSAAYTPRHPAAGTSRYRSPATPSKPQSSWVWPHVFRGSIVPTPVTSSPFSPCWTEPASMRAPPCHLCSHPDGQRVRAATPRACDQEQPSRQRALDRQGQRGKCLQFTEATSPRRAGSPPPHTCPGPYHPLHFCPDATKLLAGNTSHKVLAFPPRCAHGFTEPLPRTQKQCAEIVPITDWDSQRSHAATVLASDVQYFFP